MPASGRFGYLPDPLAQERLAAPRLRMPIPRLNLFRAPGGAGEDDATPIGRSMTLPDARHGDEADETLTEVPGPVMLEVLRPPTAPSRRSAEIFADRCG